jgi:hypothetical protein
MCVTGGANISRSTCLESSRVAATSFLLVEAVFKTRVCKD